MWLLLLVVPPPVLLWLWEYSADCNTGPPLGSALIVAPLSAGSVVLPVTGVQAGKEKSNSIASKPDLFIPPSIIHMNIYWKDAVLGKKVPDFISRLFLKFVAEVSRKTQILVILFVFPVCMTTRKSFPVMAGTKRQAASFLQCPVPAQRFAGFSGKLTFGFHVKLDCLNPPASLGASRKLVLGKVGDYSLKHLRLG